MLRLHRYSSPVVVLLLIALWLPTLAVNGQDTQKPATPRRPLPKPATGSRGFEQAGRDASSRLIAAGATRGPLKPIAPYEGLSYDEHPLFVWTPTPGATSYHFTLRDGTESGAPVVYETDVKTAQFSYPREAPPLTRGKLYSWRVSVPGVLERKQGAIATFFILAGDDRSELANALAAAKLVTPTTPDEKLNQARIFEQFGIWYDAFAISLLITLADPTNTAAKSFNDALLQKLRQEAEKAAASTASSSLDAWRQLLALMAANNESGVRSFVGRNKTGAAALYKELLFESFTARLYGNPSLPFSDELRKLLASSDEQSSTLENRFNQWLQEKKLGDGFKKDSDDLEQILYLVQVAQLRGADKDPGSDALAGSAPELTQRALQIAEDNGIDLAVASLSASLAVYALREKRLEDFNAPLERATVIWTKWDHPVGLFQAPLLRGYAANMLQKWQESADFFARAAELARKIPELRRARVNALSMRAHALRNLGDKDGVLTALMVAVKDEEELVRVTSDEAGHLQESKQLASLVTELGGALAALGKHVEAGELYARAEVLQTENYQVERRLVEKDIADTTASFRTRIEDKKNDESFRKILAQTLDTFIDAKLSYLDSLASSRNDFLEMARIADARLTLARQGGETDKIANGLQQVANAYRRAGELDKARKAATEALSIRAADPRHRWIYETSYLLAQIADDADDWDEALTRYREVIEQTKPGVLPTIYDLNAEPSAELRPIKATMNSFDLVSRASKALDAETAIGVILARKGNYREADQHYQAVLTAAPGLFAIGAPDEVDLLSWLSTRTDSEVRPVDVANHRRQTGVTPDAGEQQRSDFAALAISSHRATVMSYRAGLYESENDLDNAAKTYERANALTTNLVGGSFTLSGTYVALARIERERGNYAAAEPAIDAALAEFVRKNEAWGIANMLVFKSALRRDQGRIAESKQLAEDALRIARPLGQRSLLASILRTLGKTESEQGGESLKSAEQHLREALSTWRSLGLQAQTAYTLDSLGQTLERENKNEEALAAYKEAVGIVENLVGALSTDVSTETFNASRGNRDLYDHLIKLLIKQKHETEALQYLERAKSKSLVDALAGANVNATDPSLKSLIERVRSSGISVREAETALAVELQKADEYRDNAKIAVARARLETAQKQYLVAVADIKRANPSYASLVAVNPTDLIEIRKHLPDKTVLLEYFPTDTELYIFVVTRTEGPVIRTVAIKRADLAQLVMSYREALDSATEPSVIERSARGTLWKDDGTPEFKNDIQPIKQATLRLYELLIAPVQLEVDAANALIIVPAGELYYLPFHALATTTTDGSLNFLIQQKSFSYLASADLLNAITPATTANAAHAGANSTLLALGNPDGSLPAATEEVSELGRLFNAANVFTGSDATVERVATTVSRASYLHFATHGFINTLDPKETYLLLAGKPDRLSVKDLVEDSYKLSLSNTRLVTLSACDTNIGGFDPSAVYSSLSRAFSKAGAPTVVASLWSVNDNSTRNTMTNFYRELATGLAKGEAMRRAQITTMKDPRFAHPFYWAPFVVLGDWR